MIPDSAPAIDSAAPQKSVPVADSQLLPNEFSVLIKDFMKRAGETSLDYSLIPRVKPLLRSAFVDEAGRLWVRRSSADRSAVFDLYSAEGKPLATLSIPHPVSFWHRAVVRGPMVYFVAQEDGEVPYVVSGRIGPAQ